MNRFATRILLIFLFIAFLSVKGQTQDSPGYPADLTTLHRNVWSEIMSGTSGRDNVQKIADQLTEKGNWPDIDYTSRQRGDWPPSGHLGRLQSMAKAYQRQGSPYYQSPALLAGILLAYNFWVENDLQCPNWWYPEIGVPMSLAPTMVLMEKSLSGEQMAKGIKILDRAKIRMTGQNKVWLSGNVLLKSLLLRDVETIRKASASIQEELKVSLQEGIQPDGSFHQHGPQIQFGNYGLAFVGDMIRWIRILRQTPFCFDESKLSILRNYMLNGQQWIVWKNQMDISACGRQLFVDAQAGKAANVANFFRQLETLDPGFADSYKKAGRYESLSGNKHFYNSDFQVQRTPGYYFSVKMCSDRVIGAESCNSENIRGYYLGDGATYLYQSGKEYENIFPYWDWKKIPGTTTLQDDGELPVLTASGYRIQSDFVGGVSDGNNGIAVLDYTRNGLSAKKSWFSFPNGIVCLGTGITSDEPYPVATAVNQSYLNGEVVVKVKDEKVVPAESALNLTPAWVLHDHTGYFFPEGGKLLVETRSVTGSWNLVALMYPNESIKSGIFKLWFDHDVKPAGLKYAYILLPGADREMLRRMEKKPAFRILENNTSAQAVISSDSSVGGVVFYKAGKIDLHGEIEADQPLVLMMKRSGKSVGVSVSDPTQKLVSVTVKLGGNYSLTQEYEGVRLALEGGKSVLKIDLPKDGEAGKTVVIQLKAS